MGDQVHICNAEAAELARALARQTGKTTNEVILLDALRHYWPGCAAPAKRKEIATWRRLLREDRKGAARPETPIEALYDQASRLPE